MKRIGRYIIRGLLGRGGMGKVFKVELPSIGKIAALKLFAPDDMLVRVMGRDRLRDLFLKEATAIASLRHPHVVAIHDFDQYGDAPFFIMNYFADNLGALIGEHYEIERPSRVPTIDRALAYIRQTLEGLACLHAAGIVHRDIKPFNLLLTPWDSIQICDFGLSRIRGETFGGPSNLNVGSPYYAAPEQEKDPDGVGPAADLYPVGVMMYRLLTGRLPNTGSAGAPWRPPSYYNSDLDSHWDQWMERALATRPTERFPSARAMGQSLKELAEHWADQKAKTCAVFLGEPVQPTRTTSAEILRSIPLKISPGKAASLFRVDALWRPQPYGASDFRLGSDRTEIVQDKATGLIWQQSGSAFPLTWSQARAYVANLNEQQFSGRSGWRMPTIEELRTLLRPPSRGEDLCLAPVFDPTQRRLWSCDRRSYTAAYYVDCEMGFVGWQDFSAPFFVRGVHSP
jgi:serine/threonine protein kinase